MRPIEICSKRIKTIVRDHRFDSEFRTLISMCSEFDCVSKEQRIIGLQPFITSMLLND